MTNTPHPGAVAHDVVSVLTRVGEARDAFHRELVGEPDIDAGVVAAVLAAHGRVSQTLDTRRTLIALASLLRSLDAWQRGLIELEELAAGCALHAAATERFAQFGDVRIELRTLDELLQLAVGGRLSSDVALRSQLTMIDRALRDWFDGELFGGDEALGSDQAVVSVSDERSSMRVRDVERIREIDIWSRAVLGADTDAEANFFRGFSGTCWKHGWVAVPVAGDQLGDDADDERSRFAAAVAQVGSTALVQIDLAPQPRWQVLGRSVAMAEPLRAVYEFGADDAGVRAVTAPRRAFTIVTDEARRFAVVERDEHHVVAGPRAFVEQYLDGAPVVEAWAAFREYVERTYEDDDPPEHLLEAARDYPRASRRGLGAVK